MQLEFQSRQCRCMGCVARDTALQEATQEVKVTDGMPDIGHVLACWGQMIIRSKEWRGDTVFANGGVMTWVLYAPEDGTEPQCVESWIPYQLKWDRMEADREGPVHISPMLRGLNARVISPRKLMVRAGAAALAEGWCPEEHILYAPGELPADIQLYRWTYPMRLTREAGEKTFQVDEELLLDGPVPEKILGYTVKPLLTESRILTNRILFRGCCNLHVIYRCREGRIRTADFEVPFSQYADLEEAYGSDADGHVSFAVTNLELNGEEQKLWIKCALVGQYQIANRELVELIEDAYSPRRQVSVSTQLLHLPSLLESRTETLTVTARVAGSIGEVVDLTAYSDVPRQRTKADGVSFEIPGVSQILSYDDNGVLQADNARWEATMEMNTGENSRVFCRLTEEATFQAVATADGTELRGKLQMQTDAFADSGMMTLTGMEIGEEIGHESNRPSLILCRSDGKSVWQLAKSFGSTVDAIRQINDIQEEPVGNRMLLIPLQ